MNKELIKRLKDNPHFIEFQEIIISQIDRLNFIGDLKEMTNKNAGETVRARAIAIEILHDILKPFIDFNEKREPTVKEIDAAKSKVGL